MKRVYVFVKGQTDEEFLHRVLPAEVTNQTEFVKAGGSAHITSPARSFLARRRIPLAVLMDADSLNPEVIEDRRESTDELIQAAAGAVPVKVVVVVPEIETWFFAVPEAIERILGEKAPADLLTLGARDPKGVLTQLSQRSKVEWDSLQAIHSLDEQEIERIRARTDVAELTQFLQKASLPATRRRNEAPDAAGATAWFLDPQRCRRQGGVTRHLMQCRLPGRRQGRWRGRAGRSGLPGESVGSSRVAAPTQRCGARKSSHLGNGASDCAVGVRAGRLPGPTGFFLRTLVFRVFSGK